VTLDIPTGPRSSRHGTVAIVVLHAVVASVLFWWSWRKWPDPLVDFGRELYVPWRLTQGQMLYRDLASLFGPLSPYLNALWFSLFGVSLTTLVVCNLAILMAMTAGIHRLLAVSIDRITATAATIAILLVSGFSQYIDVGNYNFITPYAHEATHGTALSVAAFAALHEGFSRRRQAWFLVCGLCFGAVTLTKPEVAIAAGVALVAGAWTMWMGAPGRGLWKGALSFLVGAAMVPVAFLTYFHQTGGSSWPAAARAIGAGWTAASSVEIAQNEFYLRGSGLDDIVGNSARMLWSFALFGGFAAVGLLLAAIRPREPIARALHIAAQITLLLAATLAIPSGRLGWALPLIAATTCGWMIVRVVKARRTETLRTQVPLMMWSVFALALLPKIVLNGRLYHYGFFLAMPALSITVALLLGLLPAAFTGDRVAWQRARALFSGSVAIAIIPALVLSNTWYRGKTVAVSEGGDRFYASGQPAMWQGPSVQSALDWLGQNAPPGATMIALPEGVMINYLSRRENPTRFINFMPPEAVAFGEHVMARSLAERPPDFLLLVHKNTTEYGYASFGSTPEYGGEILPWVRRNYRTVEVIGQDPANADGRGIEILKRIVKPD
jgi:hypothetical protein